MSKKWILQYETGEGGLPVAQAQFPAHKKRLDEFQAAGTLLMVGTLGTPPIGALAVFTTREAAEAFTREDPFVLHGAVKPGVILEWNEVLT
jgi:uncharacterized protein YciI